MSKSTLHRPLDPKTGVIILGGSMVVSLLATAVLGRLLVWPQETLAGMPHLPQSSNGLWVYIGAAIIFPLVFGGAFLRLAKGVAAMRLVYAYAGVLYFLQSWAEFYVTGDITMWPQLAATAVASLIFKRLADRNAPPAEDDESGLTSGE